MKITTKYDHFQNVYIASDPEQQQRQVVEMIILPTSLIVYKVRLGIEESEHYEGELTSKPDANKRLGIDKENED